jgi:hypothetical protein
VVRFIWFSYTFHFIPSFSWLAWEILKNYVMYTRMLHVSGLDNDNYEDCCAAKVENSLSA